MESGPSTYGWSWGAFVLYPVWGLYNGCKWALFVGILLGWTLLPSLVFGIMGKRYSWENAEWKNYEEFVSEQKSWDTYGLYALLADLLIVIFWLLVTFL